jgi:hypothetical protein
MDSHNVLQQMLKAPFEVVDPGDAGFIDIDRDRLYCSLNPAGTETRYLRAPNRPGIVAHLGCIAAQTVTVYVYDSAGNYSDTITFSAAAQWIGLFSVEASAGVYHWQVTDLYGCTSDLPTTGDFSGVVNNGTITNLVGTAATIAAASIPSLLVTAASIGSVTVGASNITALTGVFKSINCSTGLTAAAITGTGIVAGTGGVNCSAGKIVEGVQVLTGGTATNSLAAITAQNALLAFTASTNKYFSLPTSASGLRVNVVNKVGSTAILQAGVATQSIQGATSFSVATSNAVGGAPSLICDGTNWFQIAQ